MKLDSSNRDAERRATAIAAYDLQEPSDAELLERARDRGMDPLVMALEQAASRDVTWRIGLPGAATTAGASVACITGGLQAGSYGLAHGNPAMYCGMYAMFLMAVIVPMLIWHAVEATMRHATETRHLVIRTVLHPRTTEDRMLSPIELRRLQRPRALRLARTMRNPGTRAVRRVRKEVVGIERDLWLAEKGIDLPEQDDDEAAPSYEAPETAKEAIAEIERLIGEADVTGLRAVFTLQETLRRYIPDVIEAYDEAARQGRTGADHIMMAQIAIIRAGVHKVIDEDRQRAGRMDQNAMKRFLEARFDMDAG